ncbi:MAG: hypothetical protein AABZ12_08355 [Planctomycetota bacterium]
MRYTLPFDDVSTGAVADTYKTIAALIVANTAGHRCRVRKISVGFSDNAPADRNVGLRLQRIASLATAGTPGSTLSGANMPKKDTGSIDSLVTGARNYSVEPTTFETEPLWEMDINDRSGLVMEWGEEEAPRAIQNQYLCVRAAPRAAAASALSGTIEFELY